MINSKSITIVHAAMAFAFFLSLNTFAQDWSSIRGNEGLGSARPNGVLSTTSDVKLQTRWKKKIGSGYSSVVVANNRVITMYTEGESDVLTCLSASDGETLWKLPIGDMFKGENGSFDGPLSTPVIHNGQIFAISPTGKIICVDLESGKEIWSKEIVDDFGGKQPLYGYVTSPIVVGGSLIVQLGVPEKSLAALDLGTGEIKWAVTTDSINSQTPFATTIEGKDIILACGGKNLVGVNPADGHVYFEVEHGGGNGSAMTPVPIGDNQYLLTLDDSFCKAFKLSANDSGVECVESWKAPSIKNTYNIPAFSDGNVFAYSTRILTCVDPESGRAHWKTRKPGDGFLITIDGHMIINTKKGKLCIAKANDEGYDEIANIKLFEDLVWSIPAYTDNSVFARSLGEIARVDIVAEKGEMTTTTASSLPLGPTFKSFIQRVESLNNSDLRNAEVDKFLAKQKSFPVIEGNVVHFIYTGDERDVALASDMFGARQEKAMVHLADTKLHYYSMKLPEDQRANYVFLIDFKPTTDSRNDRVATSSMYAGEMEFAVRLQGQPPLQMSWFSMPAWTAPAYLAKSTDQTKVELIDCEIKVKPNAKPKANENDNDETEAKPAPGIKFQVYVPADYADSSSKRYPTAYFIDGASAKKMGGMPDAIAKSNFKDTIIVFYDPAGPGFGKTLVDKIVPYIDENYRTNAEREKRLVIGFGFAATDALTTAANSGEVFGAVAVQSPLAFAAAESAIISSMKAVTLPTKVLLQWGRFDMHNPDENWDLRDGSKKIFDSIAENNNIELTGGMVNDSTDWSSWRNRYEDIFALLN